MRARRCENNKFVTVGVPQAETTASLILLLFNLFSYTSAPPGLKNPKLSWWNLFRGGDGGREAPTLHVQNEPCTLM